MTTRTQSGNEMLYGQVTLWLLTLLTISTTTQTPTPTSSPLPLSCWLR